MSWQSFIRRLEKDFRISGSDLEKMTSIDRHIFYKLKSGINKKPRQSTVKKLEEGLSIKIDDSDPENVIYTQNLFDKNIELFSIDTNEYPIVSQVLSRSEIFNPQNIIGKMTLPYSRRTSLFVFVITSDLNKGIFNRNDKLLIDMDGKPRNGSVVACRLKGGEQFIRYYRCLPEGFYQFYSDDLHDETITVRKDMIDAIYKVAVAIKYF